MGFGMTLSLEDCSLARRFPNFFDFVDVRRSEVRTTKRDRVFSAMAQLHFFSRSLWDEREFILILKESIFRAKPDVLREKDVFSRVRTTIWLFEAFANSAKRRLYESSLQ